LLLLQPTSAFADVLQHHNQNSRDGLYVDPLFTRAAARTIHRDSNFHAPLSGPMWAQPLYVTSGPGGTPAVIAATDQNDVSALDAATGSTLWTVHLGPPVPLRSLSCGNVDPVGITGTPVIDIDSRTIFVNAMTSPDDGEIKQHFVHALSLDDGSTLSGWPVEIGPSLHHSGFSFNPAGENQRGGLTLQDRILYVPYGGHAGDCGDYRGWLVGVPLDDPAHPIGWATDALGGGSWATGGVASDGTFVYFATGNTFGANSWMGGEAILRFTAGPTFSGDPADFFTPSNWMYLDDGDLDLGGTGPVLVDVPGASPSALVVALGKNGVAYLLDRDNLGGIGTGDGIHGEGMTSELVSDGEIKGAAAAYTTSSGTYVVFNTVDGGGVGCPAEQTGDLIAFRIGSSSPPTITVAWCADNGGRGSPIVTTTDGSSEPVIWTTGAYYTNRLHGYDGETGELLFDGGGEAEQMTDVGHLQTPIVVDGRIFVAAFDEIYAFTTQ